jgi:lipopolysaccharide heptosyltransferase II
MSAHARPPEGGAPSLGEDVAQRQEGRHLIGAARPPEGGAPSLGEDVAQRQEGRRLFGAARPPEGGAPSLGEDVASPDPRWQAARRVLAIRLDNLGDVLMTTPALMALRRGVPDGRLALLTSPAGAALAPHLPWIDQVLAAQVPWVKHDGGHDGALGRAEARLVERLASLRFDAAVIFTVCTQSALPTALLCRMAGIPLRLAHCRENPYGLLSDWVRDTEQVEDGMRHEVERQLALVGTVGFGIDDARLRFEVGAHARSRLGARLLEAGLRPGQPYFVVHPGASAASRRYPAEHFGQAARRVAQDSGCTAVFTGAAQEQALVERARAAMGMPSISLAGELGLGELAALVESSRLLLANNSGPSHIAAAVGTPVVTLYALTNPQHRPWQVAARVLSHDVPCRNCLKSICPQGHHDCLMKITPQCVAEASLKLLRETEHEGMAA